MPEFLPVHPDDEITLDQARHPATQYDTPENTKIRSTVRLHIASATIASSHKIHKRTHLGNRYNDHLRRAFVHLLQWLTGEEAEEVCGGDGCLPAVLAQLLLLGQVEDVTEGEHAWVALDFEGRVDFDEAA